MSNAGYHALEKNTWKRTFVLSILTFGIIIKTREWDSLVFQSQLISLVMKFSMSFRNIKKFKKKNLLQKMTSFQERNPVPKQFILRTAYCHLKHNNCGGIYIVIQTLSILEILSTCFHKIHCELKLYPMLSFSWSE